MFGFKVVKRSELKEIADRVHAFQIGYEDLDGGYLIPELNELYKELDDLAWSVYHLAGYEPGRATTDDEIPGRR